MIKKCLPTVMVRDSLLLIRLKINNKQQPVDQCTTCDSIIIEYMSKQNNHN